MASIASYLKQIGNSDPAGKKFVSVMSRSVSGLFRQGGYDLRK